MDSEQGEATDQIVASIDSAAFDEFWGWGRRYARRLLGNEADCEDVVQEAFCRLVARESSAHMTARDTPRPARSELAAIFFTTVRNLCIDKLRRNKARSNVSAEQWIEAVPSAESQAIANETRQQIESGLARLPEHWRQALMLRAAFELNYEEISQIMNSSRAQIRTWIFRARQQLSGDLQLKDRP